MSRNIFTDIPLAVPDEIFEKIIADPACTIERIVSCGQKTPVGTWLCAATHEWVIVLKGTGQLLFEEKAAPVVLGVGDYVFIPAGTRHRVECTTPDSETIWLAVHWPA